MQNFIEGAKYRAETVSITSSFADVLPAGQVITGTPSVIVTVVTGFDASPNAILYQGCNVIANTGVDQKVRLGVTGVIYHIEFQVVSTSGLVFEKDCYLAILPDDDSAVPTWLPLWEATQLYPYQDGPDSVRSGMVWVAGALHNVLYHNPPEAIQSRMGWITGTLIIVGVTYHNPHEDMQSYIVWNTGTLITVGVRYDNPHEDVKSNVAWITGTLINQGILYHNPHEDIQSTMDWTAGTLT